MEPKKICRHCGAYNAYTQHLCEGCGFDLTDPSTYDVDGEVVPERDGIKRIWSVGVSQFLAIVLIIPVLFGNFLIFKMYVNKNSDALRYKYNGTAAGELVEKLIDTMDTGDKEAVEVSNQSVSEENTTSEDKKSSKRKKKKKSSKKKGKKKSSKNKGYVLPGSNKKYISVAKLRKMSLRKLAIARNEIYARRGYKFIDKKWQNYFKKKKWYHPKYSAKYFNAHSNQIFNKYERENIKRIKREETRKQG